VLFERGMRQARLWWTSRCRRGKMHQELDGEERGGGGNIKLVEQGWGRRWGLGGVKIVVKESVGCSRRMRKEGFNDLLGITKGQEGKLREDNTQTDICGRRHKDSFCEYSK